MVPVDAELLKLPECPIPRPGEKVSWYASSRLISGDLTGYDSNGRPLIINEFGHPATRESIDQIRLQDPFKRRGPNWLYLPNDGQITRPSTAVVDRMKALLGNPIPPGPSSFDLALEIWNRGFEIYLVGGTVRDILRGALSNDIDFVTTMPLNRCKPLIASMFRYNPSSCADRGFIRIGGKPSSGDPFIDLKIFSDCLPGTEDAAFGVGFDRDVAHRDFACNAVYFDPINEVLIDPTGFGVQDAIENQLTLICTSGDAYQHAQVFLRFFKFCGRGFTPTGNTAKTIVETYSKSVGGMKRITRIRYFRAQVLHKCKDPSDYHKTLLGIEKLMTEFGAGHIWEEHFAPLVDEMCQDE